jgi:rfaE bifunctional protein nucleotidyltransferase chain/domain
MIVNGKWQIVNRPKAGVHHEVGTGSGSDRVIVPANLTGGGDRDPVATAPGTDLIMLDYSQMSTTKILYGDELLAERARLRAAGEKLVFTNGVFDILHVGHVRYLAEARALGDALVVAINSDASVRELKGAGRPLMNENERAEILAALRAISYVTIFDDVSPRKLIAELLPDVLVKGGDYALDEIHGREEVEAAGGRVVSLPFVEGVSTSGIIEQIKK